MACTRKSSSDHCFDNSLNVKSISSSVYTSHGKIISEFTEAAKGATLFFKASP